jgi:hypothetical protein
MIVMRSRYVLLVLPLLAVSNAPAVGQEIQFVSGTGEPAAIETVDNEFTPATGESDDEFSGITNKISDPAVQDGVAAAVESATEAMMSLPIGQFAEVVERARPGTVSRSVRRDSTVADIAGRDARYLPEELGERSREAMGMMGGFARAMVMMMPELERMGREMEESFRAAKAQARRNRN